jgi:prepilin-type processing-associated H-X9-DG protein
VRNRITRLTRDSIDNESRLALVGDLAWFDHWDPSPGMKGEFPHWHGRRCGQNIAFMDGHVSSVRIRKAIQVDESYTVIPFAALARDMLACQSEVPCR